MIRYSVSTNDNVKLQSLNTHNFDVEALRQVVMANLYSENDSHQFCLNSISLNVPKDYMH